MFDEIISRLLRETRASRTTLRLDEPGASFPVVAEALATGVRSIRDATQIDVRSAPTFLYMATSHELLIQDDLLTATPAAPRQLIELYGARAQMLAPIVMDETLVGIVSVHECRRTRKWLEIDIESLRIAREDIRRCLLDVGRA